MLKSIIGMQLPLRFAIFLLILMIHQSHTYLFGFPVKANTAVYVLMILFL